MDYSLAFRPDGREVAGADPSGSVHLWNPETGTETKTVVLRSVPNAIVPIAYSPDGRYLAAGHG